LDKLKFAVIGCGRIAARHAEIINKIARLSAVCDIKPERAKALAEKYSCSAYNAIEDLLKNETDVNVVSICTPNYLHSSHTILSLNAGMNVLCEKPMAISIKECEEMIRIADKNKKNIYCKTKPFNPPVALDRHR
jgi:predicted dehydrogenase